jgi:hypothetical protein
MSIRIEHDSAAPNAAVELTIRHPLPDYDLEEVEAAIPRDVDPMLASQGFHDLLDEARGILAGALLGTNLEVTQLTGAICSQGGVHRPGVWLVLRETGAPKNVQMSAAAKTQVAALAEDLRARLQLA